MNGKDFSLYVSPGELYGNKNNEVRTETTKVQAKRPKTSSSTHTRHRTVYQWLRYLFNRELQQNFAYQQAILVCC